MILRSIVYESSCRAPSFEVENLGVYNELSGDPASGKTLILNVIGQLASSLAASNPRRGANDHPFTFSGLVVATFSGSGGNRLEYRVGHGLRGVTSERVTLNGDVLLEYGLSQSRMFFAELGEHIEIEDADDDMDVMTAQYFLHSMRPHRTRASRLDFIQHPYLVPLINWGCGTHFFNAEEVANTNYSSSEENSGEYLTGTERRKSQLASVADMLRKYPVALIDDYREDLWPGFHLPMAQVIVAHSTSYSGGRGHVTHDLSCAKKRVVAVPRDNDLTLWPPATPPPPRSA